MIYFGCIGDKGHYAFGPNGKLGVGSNRALMKLFPEIDSGFCPKGQQTEGVVQLTHQDGWTIMAFWDRSVDSRPGSHSTFLRRGNYTFDEMVERAKEKYPMVWERYNFPIIPP